MYSRKKLFFIILTVIVFIIDIIISYIIGLAIVSYINRTGNVFIEKIKQSMIKNTTMGDTYLKIINEYSFDHNNKSPHKKFNNWDSDVQPLGEMCKLGFKLLEYYGSNQQPYKYLQIAEDIILRIDKALSNVSKFKSCENNDNTINTEGLTVYPWGNNWYEFSVYIPRLMVMYEYVGRNKCIKEYVCHKNICRLIPALNMSLDIFRYGVNMVYIALPRLLTNYLYDRETYEKERNSKDYDDLCKVYNIEFLTTDKVAEGMYEDGSYIFHRNVATYSYLVTLHDYNENVFLAINGTYKLREIVTSVLEKLLHPTIPYTTLGLFGRNGERIGRNWWNIKGKLGIAMMPFIGLGLFKTERFMFSLRVQRPGIAAYETDIYVKGEFALGWVQLRKLYLAKRTYPNPVTWQILKNEPGIMSIQGEEFTQLLPEKKDYTVQSYICEQIKNSYIGRLIDPELMFWRNQYKFSKIYDCFVVEMGVATHNGFEIYYYIDNRQENRTLQFRVIDNNIRPDDSVKIDVEGANIENGFIQINPRQETTFTWRTVFDPTNKTVIDSYKSSKDMTFYYDTKKYVIAPQKNKKKSDKKLYFTVSCFNSDGQLMYIIGGSSSSKLYDVMKNEETLLKRNSATYMYIESKYGGIK